MARDYQLISADSHVLEPPHIWTTYVPKKFHDKVPRVVPDGEGGEAWQFAPDIPPAPIGIYASAGRKHEDIRWTGDGSALIVKGKPRPVVASKRRCTFSGIRREDSATPTPDDGWVTSVAVFPTKSRAKMSV